jgi:hypothetical protein
MNFPFLDAGGAGLIQAVLAAFFIITVIVEAIVMFLFKINNIGRVLLYSLIVNAVSLGIGYLLLPVIGTINSITFNPSLAVLRTAIFFAVTVLVEGSLLMLLNKKQHKHTIWLAAVTMNLASYLILYLFFR